MLAKDWTSLYNEYRGLWVALQDDEVTVIAYGKKVADVLAKAAKNGYTDPILFKVPTKDMTYIGRHEQHATI